MSLNQVCLVNLSPRRRVFRCLRALQPWSFQSQLVNSKLKGAKLMPGQLQTFRSNMWMYVFLLHASADGRASKATYSRKRSHFGDKTVAFWCQERKMTRARGARLSVLKLLWKKRRRKKREPIYSGVKSSIGNRPASIQVHCRWPDCERHSSVWHTRQPGCDKRQFLELEIRFQLRSAITVISTDVNNMQIRRCITSVLIMSHIGLQYISQIVRGEYMCWD